MRLWGLAGVLATALAVARGTQAQPVARAPTTGFVRREGTRFVLAGAPFRFVGANVSVTHGPTQRAALDRVLDAVAEDGLRVVRVWALGEYPADAPPWARDYAWRLGPEGWVEETAIHLDRVLDAARARGLRVVLVLGNRWADYGGATRYLQWAGLRAPDATGALSATELGGLFRDATAEGLYRAHVARVVGRVSSTTGRPYRDDPAVFAWELINESEALPRDRDALVAWTQTLARQVRALDPNHLVAAGHIGYRRAADRATWRMVQSLDAVDYADGHAYPAELGSVPGLAALDAYVDDHAQLARHVLAKPFVWGEFGFGTLSPTHRGLARTAWTARFLARSLEDGVAGALAWIYAPADPAPREHAVYVDGPQRASSLALRAALAHAAAQMHQADDTLRNPKLHPALGDAALWDTRRRVMGPGGAGASGWLRGTVRGWTLRPESYAEAFAEGVGRWDRFAVMHVYGSGRTRFVYRLRARWPRRGAGQVTVRFRASSELPGRGDGATADDASRVEVALDGVPLGAVEVPPDDGLGRWVSVHTRDVRAVAALGRAGVHTLTLTVPAGPRGNGLCLYGHPTGVEPVPPGAGPLPGRVEVTLGP